MKNPTVFWFFRDLHYGRCYFLNLLCLDFLVVLQTSERCTSMGSVWGFVTLLNLLLDNKQKWALVVLRAVGYFVVLATGVRGNCTRFYVVACAGEYTVSLEMINGVG